MQQHTEEWQEHTVHTAYYKKIKSKIDLASALYLLFVTYCRVAVNKLFPNPMSVLFKPEVFEVSMC